MKETELQKELIDELKRDGGFGTKLYANFIHGMPDLYLTDPNRGQGFIEVKICKGRKSYDEMLLGETANQREFARNLINGGANAGFLMCFDKVLGKNVRFYQLVYNKNLILSEQPIKVSLRGCEFLQKYGEPYPTAKILQQLVDRQQ